MIGWYSRCRCEQAKEYYFDYLELSSRWTIPPAILTHLATCPDCQGQIRRLADMMSEVEASESADAQGRRDAALIDLLEHHFAYTETPVACSAVKPFLPSLADGELEVRIPTPVTSHLDRCEDCRNDLATLRQYCLSGRQLHRLTRFFGGKGAATGLLCVEASDAIAAVGGLCFEAVRAEALEHVCLCPTCRDRVRQYRAWLQTEWDGRGQGGEGRFPCQAVSVADLFDYVLPYGLDPQNDPCARFRQSLCEHLRRCPTCLAKIQQLHEQIFAMADRTDSGVTTRYCLAAERVDGVGTLDVDRDLPAGQISVSQADDGESPLSGETLDRRGRTAVRRSKAWPAVKAVAATAAILLVVIGLASMIPAAKAVSLQGIVHAFEKAGNVHITMCLAADPRPLQEMWLSRDLNQHLIRQKGTVMLWDLTREQQTMVDPTSGAVRTWPIAGDRRADVKESLDAAFGMLRFGSPASVPAGAQWGQVDSTPHSPDGRDVYELRWVDPGAKETGVQWKWRVTVDSRTSLPQRAEYYLRGAADPDYTLDTVLTFEYLTRDQMQAVIAACMDLPAASPRARP